MSQKRKFYNESYLDYEFSYVVKDGVQIRQCVVCLNTFSNGTMKPSQLRQHLANCNSETKEKDRSFFQMKLSSLKRMKLNATGTYQQTNMNIVRASYFIALQVAKTKKAHTICETLVKPCILESVKLVLGEEASNKMKQISLSNDTIRTRINEISNSIKIKVVSKILSSPLFSLQLDESTDVSSISQLLVFCRYITDKEIEEEFLFCQPLETTTKSLDVMEVVTKYFEETGLSVSDKGDLLTKFNKEGFEPRLAYLADIFEALNILSKKMQGTKSNVIIHTDIINAFIAKTQALGQSNEKR